MKKILVICMAVIIAATMTVSAFAFGGGFLESPSKKPAPELVSGSSQSEECEAEIIVTAYGDRDELSEEARQSIEHAYAMILGVENVSELNDLVHAVAEEKGIAVENVAVSELFDISSTECPTHELHGHFDITLKAEALENFVCLLHYHGNVWHVVDSAEVTHNGEHLEFDAEEFSPFAIVVSTEPVAEPAADYTVAIVAASVSLAVLAIIIAVFLKLKKNKKEA